MSERPLPDLEAGTKLVLPLRIVHITPAGAPPVVVAEKRERELRRIFGDDIEISYLTQLGCTPTGLATKVEEALPDAVVLASATPEYRDTIMGLASGPELVADGALADRSAIVEELAIQRAL